MQSCETRTRNSHQKGNNHSLEWIEGTLSIEYSERFARDTKKHIIDSECIHTVPIALLLIDAFFLPRKKKVCNFVCDSFQLSNLILKGWEMVERLCPHCRKQYSLHLYRFEIQTMHIMVNTIRSSH